MTTKCCLTLAGCSQLLREHRRPRGKHGIFREQRVLTKIEHVSSAQTSEQYGYGQVESLEQDPRFIFTIGFETHTSNTR